jgi:AAA ATPase domain
MNTLVETIDPSLKMALNEILNKYATALNGIKPDWYLKSRPDGEYLIIEFACPTEFHFGIHNEIVASLLETNYFKERSAIQVRKKAPKDRLLLPETLLLKKVIAESLTIDKNSFNDNFFSRYTASVAGLEQQIQTKANFVVYGRRGAGKSSLLAYALHTAIKKSEPYSWIAMQTYAQRSDNQVVPAVLSAILYELNIKIADAEINELIKALDALSEGSDRNVLIKCDRLIPRIRRVLGVISSILNPITIFLDDIHVIDQSIQPLVLSYVYKLTRGNNGYIKISGIEQLTSLWDSETQTGLQPPHDAQILNLDLNLTMPDKSQQHIISILDAHAKYCGLPNISYLSGDGALSRLVLAAAGVPRDSLNLFSIGMSKAVSKNQKLVSITSINAAASDMVGEKIKDIERDTVGEWTEIQNIIAEVRDFCIAVNHKNAFLVEIKNSDERYKLIQKLIALRLVHLLSEGITPRKAGERFIALMLDYGFYVGIRAARSVDFIPSEPRQLLAKELRSLPIFV